MRAQSVRVRLTAWYLAVLAIAMALLAAGSWWLFRRSTIAAADAGLGERIENVTRFIESMQRQPSTELQEELSEYGQLSGGDTFLEVAEDGKVIYQPPLAGWSDVRFDPVDDAATTFRDRVSPRGPYRAAAVSVARGGRHYRIVAAIPMGQAYAAWNRFGWLLALWLPIVGVIAAAGGYWISGRALAPVDRMTRAAQDISLRNLDRRIDVPRADDELRRLAETFNEMLGRLQASVGDMVRFTADASHELRTPVTLIRATTELALSRPRSDDAYREALAEVLEHAERMSVLVADLLSLARADAGVEPGEMLPTDLRSVAEEAARAVQPAVRQRGLAFELDTRAGAMIDGAPESLRRLLLILLDNAIKYTPPGGWVQLAVGRGDRGATIEATDSGPGIDAAERPFIFDRFYRGAVARAQTEGSGLGLSLARTIVERHGGVIDVGSGPGGRGCRILIHLPPRSPEADEHRGGTDERRPELTDIVPG